jgi:hypothetical protein
MSLVLNSGFTIGPGVVLDANPASPPITPVSAGLRLHLDAGNTGSYPGSGTTWTDLVDGKQFTLYNGPDYYSIDGGYLMFNPEEGQYAEAPSFPATLPVWSLEAWHYYTGNNSSGSPCIITENYTGAFINFTLGSCADNSPNLQVGHWDGSSFTPTPEGTVLTSGQWYHIVGTYDGSIHNLYINGTLSATGAASATCIQSGGGIRLMSRWDYTQYWGGALGVVRIYETTLDLANVAQNFNADRARFGL